QIATTRRGNAGQAVTAMRVENDGTRPPFAPGQIIVQLRRGNTAIPRLIGSRHEHPGALPGALQLCLVRRRCSYGAGKQQAEYGPESTRRHQPAHGPEPVAML